MKLRKHLSILLIILTITHVFSGCNSKSNIIDSQSSFDSFIKQVFINEVKNDSITLNYSLADPEKYGIEDMEPTLGEYTIESMQESLAISENYLNALKKYNYRKLTENQKLTYDVLQSYLELGMQSSDLLLYRECLSPTIGIQAQLPILLAEYNFHNKKSIDDYIALLSCIPNYFNEIILFEKEKSKAGLFMSDSSVTDIINQCNEFIADKENNYLIEVFDDKISSFPDLSSKEIKEYKAKNKKAILNEVIPAYETLICGLVDLKGSGRNENGLCYFPKGKDYYEYLVKSSTGSKRSIEDINTLIETNIQNSIQNMATIINKDPTAFDKVETLSYPYTDPEEIIEYLSAAIKEDFPELSDVNCKIKYVHKSLEDNLSPAFYLTPPMDNYSQNCIYINGGASHDLSDIFPTLAHEGYPGHLYQTVYYNQKNPEPLRNLLTFSGYSEGWATYAELYSFHLANLDPNIADLLEYNLIATLCMYAKIDIGINYFGWKLTDTTKYLDNFGITNAKDIETIHKSMIQEPANYLKYTLGYLEIMDLRKQAEEKLGDNFNLKDFHAFLLDIGPAQFHVINERLVNLTKK